MGGKKGPIKVNDRFIVARKKTKKEGFK